MEILIYLQTFDKHTFLRSNGFDVIDDMKEGDLQVILTVDCLISRKGCEFGVPLFELNS